MEKNKRKYYCKIDTLWENFVKRAMENKYQKEEVKFDIKELDSKINSLNLFNDIKENKHNEIKELINKKKEETRNKIINIANSLSNWSDKKSLKVQEGYAIMIQKSDTNLGTKDLNQIINILINEVMNYPRF